MQNLLIYLLFTFFYLIGEGCALRIIYAMIQEDAPLDIAWKKLTGRSWQQMLKDLYASDNKTKNNLGKALGDCEMCMGYWFAPVCFILYYALCNLVGHYWITDAITIKGFWYWPAVCLVNFIWYGIVHMIGAVIGWFSLIRYKAKMPKTS